MKKLLGCLILAGFAGLLIWMTSIKLGWREATIVILSIIVVVGLIYLAVWLIVD